MPATQTAPRRTRKGRQVPSRPVPELLLELAYRLHTTRAVPRPSVAGSSNGPSPRDER